uniref:Uncharacterized protein n=1 Tax=Phenylobacterium glaciei TaxID=2803784 RepID=A0A974P229_9CAUL|nr:hypothetical protein JKL49_19755 [Phenylobacterium glaciei]
MVEAIGPGVTRVAVGDRIATLFFQNWQSGRPIVEKLSSSSASRSPARGRNCSCSVRKGSPRSRPISPTSRWRPCPVPP